MTGSLRRKATGVCKSQGNSRAAETRGGGRENSPCAMRSRSDERGRIRRVGPQVEFALDFATARGHAGEVGAAGGDEHDPLLGDAPQRGLGTRQPTAVAPRGERHHVLVHRCGERRRAAVSGQLSQHLADLGVGRPSTSQLDGHQRRHHPRLFELAVVLAHEPPLEVGGDRAFGETRTHFADDVVIRSQSGFPGR